MIGEISYLITLKGQKRWLKEWVGGQRMKIDYGLPLQAVGL